MSARKLLTLAAVSALLLGGVAAVSAADPGAAGAENESNNAADNATDATEDMDSDMPGQAGGANDAAENGSNAADRSNSVGPSDGLPEQVPDHVSQIHDAIESFLNDTIANLGEIISNIVETPEDAGDAAEDDEEMSGEETSNDEQTGDEKDTAPPADVPA